jgi:ATP-dependent DNA helicase RecG
MFSLTDSIIKLHLLDQKALEALNHLGVRTIEDLLYYFPRDWQDLSEIKNISEIRPDEKVTIRAKIKKLSQYRTPRRRMNLTQSLLEDQTGSIPAVWFNQPFLKNVLCQGREYYFHGKAQIYETLQLQNPTFELVKEKPIHTAGIVPSYELTENLTQKQVRYWLKLALAVLPQVKEHLPEELKVRLKLLDLKTAIGQIHFPKNQDQIVAARKRLSFDELFLFQLALQGYKQKLKILRAPLISFNASLVRKFVSNLPFKLTNSQRLAAWEILKDLARPFPMNRLLEGEVGSGKTVVAGIAVLEVAIAGWQSVLLAPTEILAWQHYQTLQELFKNTNLEIALLTRSHKTGSLAEIAAGNTKVIIGTHALLQEKVAFQRIGLLVIDEQHRFGVRQRSHLQTASQQGLVPHLLSMTATPIPRTLALAFYGDLDISQLRELPRGRKKIVTKLVSPEKRSEAYTFVKKMILAGQQAYVITPLIDESDKLGVKSATQECEKLKNEVFPDFSIALLHGRMPAKGGPASGGKVSKEQVMNDFRAGKIQILVSTTVIEVGIDVPNATVMIIENAERFGLAQLHQLRGRVGRGDLQSYCLLFAENASQTTLERLDAVVKSTDGFLLAEKDLELRGPGEIMGFRQSGFIPFKIAKLSDRRLIKTAKEEAENLLAEYPQLEKQSLLKTKVEFLARNAHLE